MGDYEWFLELLYSSEEWTAEDWDRVTELAEDLNMPLRRDNEDRQVFLDDLKEMEEEVRYLMKHC